jgi:hypothetical protein
MVIYIIFILLFDMSARCAASHLSSEFRYESPVSTRQRIDTQKTWRSEDRSEDAFFKSQVSLAETC